MWCWDTKQIGEIHVLTKLLVGAEMCLNTDNNEFFHEGLY